ncbi:oxygenase MpaB family protein [Mycolicibacterium tusciae]|uniref:oxygenase MpaB family protein n=1 Tax=Mycolicibacterium tusciae TaxID=75922 RepID=UPI00024A2297|nr:oxygenase MpaB family protein [Mycolicibacterium tusciae]
MTSHSSPSDGARIALGPQSLLWRWAGDMRIAFEGGTAGLLQTMHPAIGQGLIDHSDFFDDPVDRVFRSLPGILGTIYNGEHAEATGVRVRDFHREIKGTLSTGDRYHALHPETFWFAHATFQRMVDRLAMHWDRHHLTDEQNEQLYAEGCEWYRRYGMSGSVVPPNRAAFELEFDRYCREVLEPNEASQYLIEFIGRRAIPDMSASPDYPTHPRLRPLTNALLPTLPVRMALAPPMRLVIFGGLPAFVRDRFGIPWSRGDERRYRGLRASIRAGWTYVPASLKWYPAARKGWLREQGRVPRSF